jgi:hypothetical protein
MPLIRELVVVNVRVFAVKIFPLRHADGVVIERMRIERSLRAIFLRETRPLVRSLGEIDCEANIERLRPFGVILESEVPDAAAVFAESSQILGREIRMIPGGIVDAVSRNRAHRRKQLRQVITALHAGIPQLCVSTQLIEAGVDVDFGVVIRSLAGLDSIAQAAGQPVQLGHINAPQPVDSLIRHAPPAPSASATPWQHTF